MSQYKTIEKYWKIRKVLQNPKYVKKVEKIYEKHAKSQKM